MKALFCNLKPVLAYWAAFLIYFALHIFSIMLSGRRYERRFYRHPIHFQFYYRLYGRHKKDKMGAAGF